LQPGNGYRLPPEAYYDRAWYEREQHQLFRRTWNYVGQTRDLPEPGDYLTADVGGGPVAVIRGDDGKLRAFHNVCRHRGAKLLDDSGNCRAIVCPYHRWQYTLEGDLKNVPQQATQFPDLITSEWGLVPAALAEWRGLLFVNPDGTAPDLESWLDEMPMHIGGYHPDELVELASGSYEFEANWKFYIENHVDWYHLWYTHPKTLRMLDHHKGRMGNPGPHWWSYEPVKEGGAPLGPQVAPIEGLSDVERENGAHLLFPNLTLFTGTGLFATGLIEPLGPERARMHFRALVAPGQRHTPELAASMLESFREFTEVEDAGMTRRLQASVRSGAFGVGPMTQDHEAPIARFHDAYLELLES
ncbi:MAG: aromatic ring-hydroxylating dioxygenase subunit alpha, partial [Pseudomonadales bacterium]|nr:aromatic ring-hydroxylating dioxygenase subunit alpha [Pseudomonadales bacterium]